MIDATENPRFQEFMKIVDKHRTWAVHECDTPEDAKVARRTARGHRLFRTEHMFYGKAPMSRCSSCGR